ncbi:hypothetical protein Dsin_028024 [Dipteronia sinensis]|uniref:Uncharacterized protein n=1 Tax=Dipteronia sinensis TaxID=43782 RepID=A0AAD9ZHQ7_9ROSI|nr:hypothetical protein Dsin_032991 [Dipteronia sinensis]KAK3188463.1 hypothetical protein Dsin_028024 [Dipteronia sinensis]
MDEPASRTGPHRQLGHNENRQKHAVDTGFPSGAARGEEFSDSDSCDSVSESSSSSTRLADLSASFRVFSESLLRRELAEMEMMKSREALRCEAEKRRMETEGELTQMLVQTQLQIASFVAGKSTSRKRKRVEEDESTSLSQRQRTLLMSLLQCNFIL